MICFFSKRPVGIISCLLFYFRSKEGHHCRVSGLVQRSGKNPGHQRTWEFLIQLQQTKQRGILNFFDQLLHYLKCLGTWDPGIFFWHNVLPGYSRITAVIQWGKICQLYQGLLFFGAELLPQILQLVPCNGDPVFQLAQIFVFRHPEMSNLSIIIEMHFQIQVLEKQGNYVLSLPDYQDIFIPFPV